MSRRIETVAVLGAGVMGATIAAHMANVGLKTFLLDIVPFNLGDDDKKKGWDETTPQFRNKLAEAGLAGALKARPPAFYLKDDAELITTGNFDDNLDWLSQADLVIEVVLERLDIKRALFDKIRPHLKAGAILASNTSGLPIHSMCEGYDEDFQKHFVGMHFFNPPRYMRLLEVIAGPMTDPEVLEFTRDFCEKRLGKDVVDANDTPNFIANRVGSFAVMYLYHHLAESGFTPEEVDALTGPLVGHAKSATFRTTDLVGLDILVHTASNVYDGCPDDEMRDYFKPPAFVEKMLEAKILGDKTRGGFFKKGKDEKGKKAFFTLDLETMEYRPKAKAKLAVIGQVKPIEDLGKRIKALVWGKDKASKFSWDSTAATLIYAANRLGEIAGDIVNIDKALRSGFAWEMGPFEIWDAIGLAKSAARMEKEGRKVPAWVKEMIEAGFTSFYKWEAGVEYYYDREAKDYKALERRPEIILLKALKDQEKTIIANTGASLVDIGDGVACLEFHTKMNSLGLEIGDMMRKSAEIVSEQFKGLVIANHAPNFSVGANLGLVLFTAQEEEWDELDWLVKGLQDAIMGMKFLDKPVVAAPAGMALGGGCEVCLGTDAIRAAAETYMGLVEVGVGVIPAGGGCKELLVRNTENLFTVAKGGLYPKQIDLMPYVARTFETIAMAKVAMGAKEAQAMGFTRKRDKMTINRDFLIHDAKQTVLAMSLEGYTPPRPAKVRLMGVDGRAIMEYALYTMHKANFITDYDLVVANKLAEVLTGGDVLPDTVVDEQYLLDMEREAFLSLCGEQRTQARMAHMLKTGKPLRN